MGILTFMANNPILTFLLACILTSGVVGSIRALRGHCDCDEEEKEKINER